MLFPSKIKERYEIREELGTGGMGAVYRAYDKIIKSEVALKTLLDTSDSESLKMFHEECDKLAKMVHPNIVEIRDIGEFDSGRGKQPYLVMPLLRGKTLDQLIKDSDKRLAISRAVDILCQACRGLQAAHDAGLIHRDLKPSNIFVLEDDSVKLIDFGVAHWSNNTRTVGRKGTLLYMSPEQVEMKGVSPSSDIFSLGVVAYQTLTGRSPFERRTEQEVVDAIMRFTPPPASEYNAEVSLALSQAVHKAMAKQPSNRYRTAREFGEILQKALHQQPIEIFNPARIQPRIERAQQALEAGDLELASEIVGELDTEGHLDPQVTSLQRNIEQLTRRKRVTYLLDSARTRLREQEYPLALQKIQEALELDKNNADALALKESVETRRAEQSVNDWLKLARQHIDNFAHDRAREALQNVLNLKPKDSRATAMLAEVDRAKSDYDKVLSDKHKHYAAAEAAFVRGEVTTALSQMNRVLQLDKQAPDRTDADRSTAYQSFYQQIRSEHDHMQNAYAEARALQASGNYAQALVICNENLVKYPAHALLQALKLDLEVSQRQKLSGFIAEVDRRVDAEPDLDKRLSILKEAIDKFPDVDHFQTNYRLARERRDLIESIVLKAHNFEEQGQINESLAQWEILRSIYERYPGLDFEFQRLRKRQAHQARSEGRARYLDQIEEAIDSNQHARALELLEAAKKEFPDDAELKESEERARTGAARVAEAGNLLTVAEQMREEGRLQEAVDTLQKAHKLDRLNPGINEALQAALIEEARGVLDTDWRTADELLKQAQDLGSGHYAVKGLLRAVADRRREEEIAGILEKTRALQTAGDIRGAYAFTSEKLTLYPQDLDIQQIHNRLKKQYDALSHEGTPPDEPAGRVSRISEPVGPAKPADTPERQHSRLMTVTPSGPEKKTEALAETQVFIPEKPPEGPKNGPKLPPPFDASKHKVKIGIGAAVAACLLAGLLFFSRDKKEGSAIAPAVVPVEATGASPSSVKVPTTIAVKTIPPDASLVINKSVRGIGNGAPIDVPAGNLVIEASLPGYKSITKQVFLNSGDKNLTEIVMELLPPSVRVETALNAGQVFLDDKPLGELQGGQFSLDSVPEGAHKFLVKAEHGFGFNYNLTGAAISPSALTAGLGGTLILVGNAAGKMQITCNRTGLTLQVDGKDLGSCSTKPVETPGVTLGRHNLEVFEAGQSLGAKTVELGPATNLGVFLLGDSGQGLVTVTSNLEEFSVNFDHHESTIPGKRNKWRRALAPGEHVITVHKTGFTVQPAMAKVTLEKGKEVSQAFIFTAIPVVAGVTLKAEPGAEVLSNGKSYGTIRSDGTLELANLPLGPFPLVLRKKGFTDYRGTIVVEAGQNVKQLSMQKERGHVALTAIPANAQIVITRSGASGQPFTSPATADLAEGSYTVEVMADGYQQITETVHVTAGETLSREFRLQPQQAPAPTKAKGPSSPGWPGWQQAEGYMTKTGGGFSPLATGPPSQVSFAATRDRKKVLGISRGGTITWMFVSSDGLSSLVFHLGDKSLTWEGTGKVRESHGRTSANFDKGIHTVRMSVGPSATSVSVDGSAAISVDADLASLGACKFGFKIDGGETLSVKNFVYNTR